jgi:hypothetical protein
MFALLYVMSYYYYFGEHTYITSKSVLLLFVLYIAFFG